MPLSDVKEEEGGLERGLVGGVFLRGLKLDQIGHRVIS